MARHADYPPAESVGRRPDSVVGRESERGLLRVQLDRLDAAEGGVVLIAGASGIGKTTLVDILRGEAAERGARVLSGGCYDLMDTPAYGPWLEAVQSAEISSGEVSALTRLLAPPAGAAATGNQAGLFLEMRDYLADLARRRPLVVVLEDLHWADAASVDLLRRVSRHMAGLPALLVATYRTEDVGRDHGLYTSLPVIVREARALRIELRTLDDESVGLLVSSRYALATSDEARLVRYLQTRAQGNPFFLHELLRELEIERVLHAESDPSGTWHLGQIGDRPLPQLVEQVLNRRLDRLAREDRQLLAVAAVIGQEVPLELWLETAGVAEDALLDVVDAASKVFVLEMARDGATVRFTHALVREALYEGLLPARRRRWHGRIAEVLMGRAKPDADAVAYHLRQAHDRRAGEWLVRAAEHAQRAYAWLTAAERYESVLDGIEQTDATAGTRARLLVVLAQLRRYTDPDWGIARLSEAARLAHVADDSALAAAAQFDRGHLRCMARDFGGGLEDMREGLTVLDALQPAERADIPALDVLGVTPIERALYHRGVLVLFLSVLGWLAEAGTSSTGLNSAVAGSTARECLGRGWRHAALGEPDLARQAFANARRAYGDQHWEVGTTYFFELDLVVIPFQTDRLAERHRLADQADAAWQRASGALSDFSPRLAQLPLLFVEGEWTQAREVAESILSSSRSNDAWRRYPGRVLGWIAREQDDPDLAWQLVQDEFPMGPATEPGSTWFLPALDLQRLAASLAIDVGDLDRARTWLQMHDRWLSWSGAVRGRAEGYLGWAAWATAGGDTALARRHAELALADASRTHQPLALVGAQRILGELATAAGQHAAAAAYLEAGLALAGSCKAVYERALTVLALASLRGAIGDQAEHRALLAEVSATCEALGARRTGVRANRLSERMKAPRDRHPDSLTPREVEVLALIATGITNQEVAERLVLSLRTVERHINSLYRKISARGRADAVAYAARNGLLREEVDHR